MICMCLVLPDLTADWLSSQKQSDLRVFCSFEKHLFIQLVQHCINQWCRSGETLHVSIDVSVRALTNDRLEAWP